MFFSSLPAIFPPPQQWYTSSLLCWKYKAFGRGQCIQSDSRIKQEKPFSTRTCGGGGRTKSTKPCERLEEKPLWMHQEKEPSAFMRLSQCSRKAALWLPASWISTPALLFIASTQSPYLPSTALDYREGMLSRETVKANEHGVKPVLQQWDIAREAARQQSWFSAQTHIYI